MLPFYAHTSQVILPPPNWLLSFLVGRHELHLQMKDAVLWLLIAGPRL
jgi:hypothetical protein